MPDAKDLDEMKRRLRVILPSLTARYHVRSLGVFGSYVRHEERPDSDLDVLIEFDETPSLFEFIQIEHELSNLLGVRIDLVMRDALKPDISKYILREVVLV